LYYSSFTASFIHHHKQGPNQNQPTNRIVEPIRPWLLPAISSVPNLYYQTFTPPPLIIIVAAMGEEVVTAMTRDTGTR
jgi:hypothetical protein